MSYGDIKARIADEMRRGDLTSSSTAIARAVIQAIEFFKRRRFYWNEFVDTTFTHSASQTYHTLSSDVIRIDSMKAIIASRDYPLAPMDWRTMDSIDSGQWFGYPDYYSIHSNLIRLYPPPNQDYTIRIAGIKELPEVSLSATPNATNAWVSTSDGEPLVRAKAKAILFRDYLRNHQQAAVFESQAQSEYMAIQRENVAKTSSGRLKPGRW